MSEKKQVRSFVTELEVRASGDGRTIRGRAVPYGQVATIAEYGGSFREMFVPGAFTRSIRERGSRLKLLANHSAVSAFPIGQATPSEAADGLWIEGRVSATPAGDEALTLVRDGVVTGLSVGFRPITETFSSDGTREIREAALLEVSLTAFPAYDGAQIASVRHALDELEWLRTPRPPRDVLDSRGLAPLPLIDAQRALHLLRRNP